MSDRLIHQPASPEFDVPVIKRRRSRILIVFASASLLLLLLLAYTQTESFGRRLLRTFEESSDGLIVSADSFQLVGADGLAGTNLKIVDRDGKALFQCRRLDLKFDLLAWLKGSLSLRSVSVEGGLLEVVDRGEGERGFGALWAKFSKRKPKSRLPLRGVELTDLKVHDCLVRFTWEQRPETMIELNVASVTCDSFAPGQECVVALETETRFQSNEKSFATMRSLGEFRLNLRESGFPKTASIKLPLSFVNAVGHFEDLETAVGELNLSIDPLTINQSGVRFSRDDKLLGSLLFSGPYDSAKREGRVDIETTPLTRPLLNLMGAVSGIDFGESVLRAEGTADWAFGGSVLSMRGKIEGNSVELIKEDARTPKTEVRGDYSFQYNHPDETLLIQKLQFTAASRGTNWFSGKLGSPVIISWGDARPGIREPVFDLSVKHFDAEAWGTFFLLDLPPGTFSVDATTTIQRDGQKFLSEITLGARDLTVVTPDGRSMVTDIDLSFDMHVEELKRLSVHDLNYTWLHDEQVLLEGNGVAAYSFDDGNYSFQVVAQGPVSKLVERSGIGGLHLSEGDLDAMLRIQNRGLAYDLTLNASFSELVGGYQGLVFDDHRFEFQLDSKVNGSAVSLKSLNANAIKGYTAAGSLGFSGNYDLESETGDIRFRATGINRFLFEEFLNSYVASEHVGDAVLRSEGRIGVDRDGENRVTGKVGIDRWQGLSADGTATVPLDLELSGSGVFAESGFSLKDGLVALSRGEMFSDVKNELEFEIAIPNSESDQLSAIEVRAKKLDLSSYIRWAKNLETEPLVNRSQKGDFGVLRELEDRPLSVDLELGGFYLDALAATNLVLRSAIQDDKILVDKFDAVINGGTVSAHGAVANLSASSPTTELSLDLDLADVPIDLWQQVILGDPEDAASGRLSIRAQIDGLWDRRSEADSTLKGQLEASLDNPVFPSLRGESVLWFTPILSSLKLPSLDALDLDRIHALLSLDKHRIAVEALALDSALLKLRSTGELKLAGTLESTVVQLPVSVFFEKQLAETAGLPSSLRSESHPGFQSIPSFLSLQGTLTKPRFAVNQQALAKLLLEAKPGVK